MRFQKATGIISYACTLAILSIGFAGAACADSISPNITDIGKRYSTEKLNTEYFGRGTGGRLSEASHLRFKGDHYLSIGDYDNAIAVLLKAVQLDTGYPEGHLLLARAMTAKLRSTQANDDFDWDMFTHCADEWKMISRHSADFGEQLEARNNLAMLKKMYKSKTEVAKEDDSKGGGKKKRSRLAGGLFGLFR